MGWREYGSKQWAEIVSFWRLGVALKTGDDMMFCKVVDSKQSRSSIYDYKRTCERAVLPGVVNT